MLTMLDSSQGAVNAFTLKRELVHINEDMRAATVPVCALRRSIVEFTE